MATNCRFENSKNYSIRFEISNNKPIVLFDSKWKTTIRTSLGPVLYVICTVFVFAVNDDFMLNEYSDIDE